MVGVFPDEDAALRLVGAVLIEQNDEWEDDKRYFSQESMRQVLAPEAVPLPPKRDTCHAWHPCASRPQRDRGSGRVRRRLSLSGELPALLWQGRTAACPAPFPPDLALGSVATGALSSRQATTISRRPTSKYGKHDSHP